MMRWPSIFSTVVEQQHVARHDIAWEAEIADTDLGSIARRRIFFGDQIEAITFLQRDLALGETFDANLGTGQIGEDANLASSA